MLSFPTAISMNAAEFYRNFESDFASAGLPATFTKQAGKTLKWKMPLPEGALYFKFSTNPKAAGLAEGLLWPGEFRLLLEWHQGRGREKRVAEVSLFQYTNEFEVAAYGALQMQVLKKYLARGGVDPYGTLAEQAAGPARKPRPNMDEWCYYVDNEDAQSWGRWHGHLIAPWTERFLTVPESREQWCRRML